METTPSPKYNRRVTRFISGNVVELDDEILNQLNDSQPTPNSTAEPEILEEVSTPPAAAPKYNRCVMGGTFL